MHRSVWWDSNCMAAMPCCALSWWRGSGKKSGLGEHARALGVVSVYLLTTETSTFFSRHGFCDIQRMLAIELIRATREFADICPTPSAFMLKQLQMELR